MTTSGLRGALLDFFFALRGGPMGSIGGRGLGLGPPCSSSSSLKEGGRGLGVKRARTFGNLGLGVSGSKGNDSSWLAAALSVAAEVERGGVNSCCTGGGEGKRSGV